jgi:hypothetical protein
MEFFPGTLSRAAILLGAIVIAFAAPAVAQEQQRPTLTVVGEGRATARPDLAIVSLGVVTQASRADAALVENSKAMTGVIAAAKEAGIAERDLRTTQVSLQPQYSRPGAGAGEIPRVVGYQATNGVTIRVRDLEKLGALLDRLVVAGSNELRGIEFSVAEPGALRDAARADAMKDAVRKAGILAEAAGVRIVRLFTAVEDGIDSPRPLVARMAMDAAPARPVVPIEAGEQEFRGRVTAVFEIEAK